MERVLAANPWLQASGYATVMSLPHVDLAANASWAGYRLAEFTCQELEEMQLECPEGTSAAARGTRHVVPIVAVSAVLLLILASLIVCAVRQQARKRAEAEAERKVWVARVASSGEEHRGGERAHATMSEPQQQVEDVQLALTESTSEPELSVANAKTKLISDLREQCATAQV